MATCCCIASSSPFDRSTSTLLIPSTRRTTRYTAFPVGKCGTACEKNNMKMFRPKKVYNSSGSAVSQYASPLPPTVGIVWMWWTGDGVWASSTKELVRQSKVNVFILTFDRLMNSHLKSIPRRDHLIGSCPRLLNSI